MGWDLLDVRFDIARLIQMGQTFCKIHVIRKFYTLSNIYKTSSCHTYLGKYGLTLFAEAAPAIL